MTNAYKTKKPRLLLGAVLVGVLAGCATITTYDSTSYTNAVNLKAESLTLIQEATDVPTKHTDEINKVENDISSAVAYEKSKGKLNGITLKQWEAMADPNGELLEGFIQKWRSENTGFPQEFLGDVSGNVSDSFDAIIQLEQHKAKQ